jgi:hypothetical protein
MRLPLQQGAGFAALHSFTTRVTLQILAGDYLLCALTK